MNDNIDHIERIQINVIDVSLLAMGVVFFNDFLFLNWSVD